MTLTRTIGVLAGVLLIMIAVVLVRAEAARLENDQARLERQAASLRLEAREQEIEIARLRNPALLRARVAGMWGIDEPAAKSAGGRAGMKPSAGPLPKRTGGRTVNPKSAAEPTSGGRNSARKQGG